MRKRRRREKNKSRIKRYIDIKSKIKFPTSKRSIRMYYLLLRRSGRMDWRKTRIAERTWTSARIFRVSIPFSRSCRSSRVIMAMAQVLAIWILERTRGSKLCHVGTQLVVLRVNDATHLMKFPSSCSRALLFQRRAVHVKCDVVCASSAASRNGWVEWPEPLSQFMFIFTRKNSYYLMLVCCFIFGHKSLSKRCGHIRRTKSFFYWPPNSTRTSPSNGVGFPRCFNRLRLAMQKKLNGKRRVAWKPALQVHAIYGL